MATSKTIALVFVLVAGFTLGGCARSVPEPPVPANAVAPLVSLQQSKDRPLGIDPAAVIAKSSDSQAADFKELASKGHDPEEGVRFGLAFYQELTGTEIFYQPRDTSLDWEQLDSLTPMMTESLATDIKEDRAPDGRMDGFLSVDANGSFGIDSAGRDIAPEGMPISTWNTPYVEVRTHDPKHQKDKQLALFGKRSMLTVLKSGEVVNIKVDYTLTIAPGPESWSINGYAAKVTSIETVSGS